jgi:hypothetical protein
MMYFLSATFEKDQPTVKKLRRRKPMRKILREQVQMGEMDIAAAPIELDSRDEIPQPSVHLRRSEVASADIRYSLRACTQGYPNG